MTPQEFFGSTYQWIPGQKKERMQSRANHPTQVSADATQHVLPWIGLGLSVIAGVRSGFYVFGFFAEFEHPLPSIAMAVLVVSGSTVFPNLGRWPLRVLGVVILIFSMTVTMAGIWRGRYLGVTQEVAVTEYTTRLAEARLALEDARETHRLLRAGLAVLEPGSWQYAGQYRRTLAAEAARVSAEAAVARLSSLVVSKTPPDTIFSFAGRVLGVDWRALELWVLLGPALILDLVGVSGFGLWLREKRR